MGFRVLERLRGLRRGLRFQVGGFGSAFSTVARVRILANLFFL